MSIDGRNYDVHVDDAELALLIQALELYGVMPVLSDGIEGIPPGTFQKLKAKLYEVKNSA